MLDVDQLIADCLAASADPQPHLAIKEVLDRAVADPEGAAAALPPERAELVRLHASPELTVLKVTWAPGMSFRPHDHRMWAAIAMYTGGEDNAFYRRVEQGLVGTGGRELRPRDVLLLGDDVIHAVTNPTTQFAGAIHVYGGDLFAAERSEWDPVDHSEQRYDVEAAIRYFEEQNRRHAPTS